LTSVISGIVGQHRGDDLASIGIDGDLPPEKWTPGYADFWSACSGVM
jgi:hypothetical protein